MSRRNNQVTKLLAKLDAIFCHKEQLNPSDEFSYSDFRAITNEVRQHFNYDVPEEIEASLRIAEGFCNPIELESQAKMKDGFGLLLASVGGTFAVIGISYILTHGISVTTTTGMLFWGTSTTVMLFGGIATICIGVSVLAIGAYLLNAKINSKSKAIRGLDVIRKALEQWASQETVVEIKSVVVTE